MPIKASFNLDGEARHARPQRYPLEIISRETSESAKMIGISFILASVAMSVLAVPTPPTLTWLYSVNLTMPAGIDLGATPTGSRAALPISGGKFWGPKFNGVSLFEIRRYPWL